MPRSSPLFLFAVILLVCVAFVMVAAQVVAKTPTGGNYTTAGTTENLTTGLVVGTVQAAPNYVIPALLVVMAIVIIGVLFLVKKKTG